MKYNLLRSSLYLAMTANVLMMTNMAYSQTPSNVPDLSQLSAYSDSIKNCTKGSFKVPDIFQIAIRNMAKNAGGSAPPLSSIPPISYEILGWQSGRCHLKITQILSQDALTSPGSLVITNCFLSQDDLKVLSDSASKMISGNFTVSSDDPASKLMQTACSLAQ